ncbi:MAG: DUF362 domain-containing protein [Candidatus Aminicenantes bacterium]|jgi:uncharacterized protein (DUF362 family)/NAD-dependent dihydropyrimidine dehydrogenase PreA subunit
MEKVYIVHCEDYDLAEKKMVELIEKMGGIDKFVSPNESVVLKTNLLAAAKPEKAVTTHPAIVSSVARMAKDINALPIIADSPGSGYPYTGKMLERTYRTTALDQVAEEVGVDLNFDTSFQIVSYPDGKYFKRFEIITPVHKADTVINLCKLKTHGFMHMTGAVKNIFGVIPGLTKPGYHAKLQTKSHFANMLIDLCDYISPRLSIMDAVIGMEGNGPHSGETRAVGLIIASTSPLAIDVVAGEIMGLPKDKNPVLVEAEKRGLSPVTLEELELIGADPQDLRISDFKLPSTVPGLHDRIFGRLYPIFRNAFSVSPRIIESKCVSCGTCRDACPMHVITVVDKTPARIDTKNCIRCYCCHEMCPHDAIELHSSRFYRLLNRSER